MLKGDRDVARGSSPQTGSHATAFWRPRGLESQAVKAWWPQTPASPSCPYMSALGGHGLSCHLPTAPCG